MSCYDYESCTTFEKVIYGVLVIFQLILIVKIVANLIEIKSLNKSKSIKLTKLICINSHLLMVATSIFYKIKKKVRIVFFILSLIISPEDENKTIFNIV
jgi:hypothetical protein